MLRTDNHSYRDLIAWKQAMDLVQAVYEATRLWPRDEMHGLTSQVRRAAVSIPSNIAEGSSRTGQDFRHFLRIALGSVLEVETQLLISERLGYTPADQVRGLMAGCAEVGKILNGLMKGLGKP